MYKPSKNAVKVMRALISGGKTSRECLPLGRISPLPRLIREGFVRHAGDGVYEATTTGEQMTT